MLWSAFTLAFYGFLWLSEHLSQSDISFPSDGTLHLQLKASKTDPYCHGCSLLLAPSGSSACAIGALCKYSSLAIYLPLWSLLN